MRIPDPSDFPTPEDEEYNETERQCMDATRFESAEGFEYESPYNYGPPTYLALHADSGRKGRE